MTTVECKVCGASLNEASTPNAPGCAPCPECGSSARLFKKDLYGELNFRGGLRGVGFTTSKSKWFAKFRSEPSFHRRLGIWVHRLMVLLKRKDSYIETVTHPETGEVLHHRSEPLSKHTGHGTPQSKAKKTDV